MEKHLKKLIEHKHALIFVGGVATALVGKKVLESDKTKECCTQTMAKVLAMKKDAEESFQDMKDNAEDIVVDASEDKKKEIYIENGE